MLYLVRSATNRDHVQAKKTLRSAALCRKRGLLLLLLSALRKNRTNVSNFLTAEE
jgi:hypothetical protein